MVWFGFADASEGASPSDAADREADVLILDEEIGPAAHESSELVLVVVPWLVSLLLHVGMVLLAFFIVWSVQEQVESQEFIVPTARLSAVPRPTLQMQTQPTATRSEAEASRTRRTLTDTLSERGNTAIEAAVDTESINLDAQADDLSKANPFDTGIRAGDDLKATFYGTGGNARRLVYLVDASGSLIDTLPFVILELKRSIGELSERQSFTVIFFQGDRAIEVPAPGLKPATAENKRRVIEWIDLDSGNITPKGLSSPLVALRQALRYRPQLLFILSDNITGQGQYEIDQQRLLASIERANTTNTKINTIQFLYPDPLVRYDLKPTLKMIAEQTGGIYKFLDGRELGIQ